MNTTTFYPRMRARLGVGLIALFLCQAGAVAEMDFEVFPLGFADPETSLQAAQTLVGQDGVAILDRHNGRLLVWAGSASRGTLRNLLRTLNVPPRNIYVEVDFLDAAESYERGASLGLESDVVIVGGDISGGVTLRPSVTYRTDRSRQDTRQSLLVASGREASLRVGERVPWVQWINRWGVRHGLYETEIIWQDVGAFLVVQPTLIGEGPYIRVRLTPELSGLVDGQVHRVRYTQVATEVTVSDGQTVSLGGLATEDDFYQRFLIGMDRSGTQRTLDIRLTPRLASP